MIYTSSYDNCNIDKYKTYSISGDSGKRVNYKGDSYSKLAPKWSFWKIWHDNIGIINEEDNNKYYIREYCNQVLSHLDPKEIYKELDNSVLLCYEPNTEFCHRHIVAAWFELTLGIKVPEIKSYNNKVEEICRPKYIKEYLIEELKSDLNLLDCNELSKVKTLNR